MPQNAAKRPVYRRLQQQPPPSEFTPSTWKKMIFLGHLGNDNGHPLGRPLLLKKVGFSVT